MSTKTRPDWIYPELSQTERCLMEVVDMPRFTEHEKTCLVMSYSLVISERAFRILLDRIVLIENIKRVLKEKHG